MPRKIVIRAFLVLTSLNVLASVINVSLPSRAATTRSYQELINDPDFTRAVKSIAEKCTVNVDLGKLKC